MTEDVETVVRAAAPEDIERIAPLAGALVRMHHATDPDRFFCPDDVERGYAWWLSRELAREGAVVLVAWRGDQIAGYAYGAVEGRDWNLLLDEHGAIHDVFVDATCRGRGVGRALVDALSNALFERGARRVVLSTMVHNEPAKQLFERCGFRPTMLEMTRSIRPPGEPGAG